jgi:hypothetical protein
MSNAQSIIITAPEEYLLETIKDICRRLNENPSAVVLSCDIQLEWIARIRLDGD